MQQIKKRETSFVIRHLVQQNHWVQNVQVFRWYQLDERWTRDSNTPHHPPPPFPTNKTHLWLTEYCWLHTKTVFLKGLGKLIFGAKSRLVVHYKQEGKPQHKKRKRITITCFLYYSKRPGSPHYTWIRQKHTQSEGQSRLFYPPLEHENRRVIFKRYLRMQRVTSQRDCSLTLSHNTGPEIFYLWRAHAERRGTEALPNSALLHMRGRLWTVYQGMFTNVINQSRSSSPLT